MSRAEVGVSTEGEHMADVVETAPEGERPQVRGMLAETRESVAAVFRNRNIRRVQLALAGSEVGDWAYATAVAVWAYDVGGPQAVGTWMAVRLGLSAVLAPFGAALADRMDRRLLMLLTDLVRAALVGGAALVLLAGGPAWAVFVMATLTSLLVTPFMVAQRSLLPSLAERPEELTAANGTASTIDSLSSFVGPALGASMLAVTSVEAVFGFNVLTFLWSMALVYGVRPPTRPPAPARATAEDDTGAGTDPGTGPATATGDADEQTEGFWRETAAGFRAIRADPGLLLVASAASVQTVIAGASAVFMLVMAVEVLGTGAAGYGYLNAVLGVGAVLGGLLAIGRATRRRLAGDMVVGVVLWSAPLLMVTAWPHPVTVVVAMALLGLGNPLVDVNMDTITQRLAPDAVMGRVFGAMEACFIATMALGALVMPFLVDGLGLRWALAVIAVPVVLLALACVPGARAIDARLGVPPHVPLLRGTDIFAPLPQAAVETIARELVEVRVPSGTVVLREGDRSDRFYVIESGRVEVTQSGRVLREEGPGDYFGEIGLLRDVPRTATITALEGTVLQALDRDTFLRVVSGHREVGVAAESTVRFRLRS